MIMILSFLFLILDFIIISLFYWLIYIFLKLANIKDNNFPNIVEFYKCAYKYAIQRYKRDFEIIEEYIYD